VLEERVSTLEDLSAELMRVSIQAQQEVAQTSRELREFKEEMHLFRDRIEAFIIEMRKQWGELANRMGTMAEDLVAPSVPRILRTVLGCPEDTVDSVAVRVRRRHPDTGHTQEFDVVAACGDYVLTCQEETIDASKA
jgi:hypothetical protein